MGKRAVRTIGMVALTALLAASGCKRGGRGADTPGGAQSDEASREDLQERKNKVVRLQGGMVFETVIHYEGGPKESWVVMSHDGRPMQPDLEMKPGAGDNDDPDVKQPVAPEKGAWAVPLRVPEWCDAYEGIGQKIRFHNLEKGFLETDEAGALIEDLRAVAVAGCDRMKYAPRQRRVQALLQRWVNKTGVQRDELTKLLKALAAPVTKPESQHVAYPCGTQPAVRHILCGAKAAGLPTLADYSNPGSKLRSDKSVLDRLDEQERTGTVDDTLRLSLLLSEVAQFKHLPFDKLYSGVSTGTLQLVPGSGGVESYRHGIKHDELLAVLSFDAEKMSFTELGVSLAAKETDPVVRFIFARRITELEEMVNRMVIGAPADAKARAKAGLDAWQAAYKANKAEMDAAYKAVDNPKDEAACSQVEAGFLKLVKGKAPKSLKEAYATALDPAVNVVLGARERCHREKGWTSVAYWEGKLLAETRSHAGPRRAAVMAFRPGKAPERLGLLPDEQTVKATKPASGGVQIEFKPKEWIEERENCVETNKIDRITSDGDIIYREICTALPPIKHTEPYPPSTVDAASGAAVKKGNVVMIIRQKDVPDILLSAHESEKTFEEDKGLRVFLGVPLL